jgi:hypothetical protein
MLAVLTPGQRQSPSSFLLPPRSSLHKFTKPQDLESPSSKNYPTNTISRTAIQVQSSTTPEDTRVHLSGSETELSKALSDRRRRKLRSRQFRIGDEAQLNITCIKLSANNNFDRFTQSLTVQISGLVTAEISLGERDRR